MKRRMDLDAINGQSGSVLVMVTVWMTVLILAAALAIEVGNWFTHKRHLQVQADAAALAAAGKFVVPCTDQPIVDEATQYSGTSATSFNQQIGGTPLSNVQMLVNSTTYYNQSSPVDTTVRTGGPCTAKMVDVKLTETDLPWLFRKLNVPFINAHARVSVRQIDTQVGALPVGVPEVNPQQAKAVFVDESKAPGDSGYVLGETPLTKATGTFNGLTIWDNSVAPKSLNVSADKIGVRIVMSGSTTNLTCGQALVECYDTGSNDGVVPIRAWDPSASAQQPDAGPKIRDATLSNVSCSDAYFSTDLAQCSIDLSAQVDAKDSTGTAIPDNKLVMNATVGNKTYKMAFSNGRWITTQHIPIDPSVGPTNISMNWEEQQGTWKDAGGTTQTCNTTGQNKCKGDFGVVQRHFSALDTRSGPLQLVQVSENGVWGSNSFPKGSTHNVVVRVGVQGNLQNAQDVNDPVVVLRVAGGGSQNQSLDCDKNVSTLKDELAFGCEPTYTVNTGQSCPSSPTNLWATAQPWNCVANQTGAAVNQVPAGMNLRVLGAEKPSSCTSPNHWSDFPNIPKGDPRIVQVFLTPYGSFSGSGSGVVPVTGFATFYVTGWGSSGSGFANPCTPPGGTDDSLQGDKSGYIYGHFIKYIQTINNGSGGSQFCDFNSVGSCVARLEE